MTELESISILAAPIRKCDI